MSHPSETYPSGICINCNKAVNTPYCSQCGQPHPPQHISLGQISADIQGRAYGTSGLFPRTLRDLFTKPGHVAATYIAGNRVTYSRPVGYFLLMITILLVLVNLLNFDYAGFLETSNATEGITNPGQIKLQHEMYQFFTNNLRLVSLVIIPFQAFFARWFFFRKQNFTYLEHTVLPLYVAAQMNILTIFSVLLFQVSGWYFPLSVSGIIQLLYFSFAYTGWIQSQSKLKVFFKSIGIYLFSIVGFSILAMIGIMIYFILNPEMLKVLQQQP